MAWPVAYCMRCSPVQDFAVAALGMPITIATGLAIDACGPVSDNARGIAEMARAIGFMRELKTLMLLLNTNDAMERLRRTYWMKLHRLTQHRLVGHPYQYAQCLHCHLVDHRLRLRCLYHQLITIPTD
ncbi:Pyrophosphate-energised proton pump [Forsythia ovata]|uniref:H(+)-exporting diphosphatase n=1 Tax=Forsythia ovata TaxID=205694 RepID=A0ABD1NY57_9LAMI